MNFKLCELRTWMIDKDCGVYDMLQELPAVDEYDQHNVFYGMSKEQVKKEINKMMRYAYGFDNDQDHPKCENFILFVDDRPVVIGGLMLEMTDYWKKHRGHIWYKTRPSERKKGYCTQFKKMLCDRAKEFGFYEVISQCDAENYGSNKVLLNNGFETYINPLCPDWNNTNFYRKTLISAKSNQGEKVNA